MIAVADFLLMLLPLGLFLAWRRLRPLSSPGPSSTGPSPGLVLALAVGVALGIGAVIWWGMEGRLPRGEAYVPATLAPDGTITPGHGERRR